MGKVSKALAKATQDEGHFEPDTSQEAVVTEQSVASPQETQSEPAKRAENDQVSHVVDTSGWDERLMLTTKANSPAAESFRALRTSILHPQNGRPPRSILVASASPDEGKSFVSAHLGIAIAQSIEEYALLIECDLRKPTLAKLFGQSNDSGLANYLSGEAEFNSLIRKTGQPKLSLMTAGPPPRNPAELLGSDKMTDLLNDLTNSYENQFVILDSPPTQAASETAVLARQVDGVVIVVRSGYSGRTQINQLVKNIGKEKLLGVVFNAFEVKMLQPKGYYSYYGKKY